VSAGWWKTKLSTSCMSIGVSRRSATGSMRFGGALRPHTRGVTTVSMPSGQTGAWMDAQILVISDEMRRSGRASDAARPGISRKGRIGERRGTCPTGFDTPCHGRDLCGWSFCATEDYARRRREAALRRSDPIVRHGWTAILETSPMCKSCTRVPLSACENFGFVPIHHHVDQ
jgi:hypothetical protein